MKALIDGDIIAYRIGFASQSTDKESGLVIPDPLPYALHSAKRYVDNILKSLEIDSHQMFLTPSKTFRNKVRDDYKANRKGTAKPVHLKDIRDYLISKYKAKVVEGMEADDALGLSQNKDTIICSVDKDLLMVEGMHYNFVTKKYTSVSAEEGHRFFHQQMLTGDATDNIVGLRGIGPKKAQKLLEATDKDLWEGMILDAYIEHFGIGEGRVRCVQNSMLLWILQRNKQMPLEFKL